MPDAERMPSGANNPGRPGPNSVVPRTPADTAADIVAALTTSQVSEVAQVADSFARRFGISALILCSIIGALFVLCWYSLPWYAENVLKPGVAQAAKESDAKIANSSKVAEALSRITTAYESLADNMAEHRQDTSGLKAAIVELQHGAKENADRFHEGQAAQWAVMRQANQLQSEMLGELRAINGKPPKKPEPEPKPDMPE